jgi:Ca-activated chloride channel family protein
VAPRRPGWQRHVASAAVAGALILLVLAFARPAHAVQVPRQRATIVLVLDTSGSMGATDVAPTTDRAMLTAAIDHLTIGGGTATGDAITTALDAIAAAPGSTTAKRVPSAIVLMSDGSPTIGSGTQGPQDAVTSASAAAKQAHVPIDTIAFGTDHGTVEAEGQLTPVPFDPATMAQIAHDTGGKTFTAQTGDELQAVYGQVGKLVGFDTVKRELTAAFTGAGIGVLTLAAAAGIWWMQRIA